MTPERWQQVTAVFHAVRGYDGAERAARLAEACKGDSSLQADVEALLAGDRNAGSFGDPRRPPSPAAPIHLPAGTTINHYVVADLIGVGGMGEVYRARDLKLGRDVALKVLPASWLHYADRQTRFDREARLLATVNHPNVAQVYGIETSGDTCAIVMELVEGKTLADFLHGDVPKALPVPTALGIARQIADGLNAAHEKGPPRSEAGQYQSDG